MPRLVFSRDGLTGGYQAAVEGGGLGRRLVGPKFCGRSTELLVAELSRDEAMEVIWHLCRDFPDLAHEYAAKHPSAAQGRSD
jgi:hypothetical protein